MPAWTRTTRRSDVAIADPRAPAVRLDDVAGRPLNGSRVGAPARREGVGVHEHDPASRAADALDPEAHGDARVGDEDRAGAAALGVAAAPSPRCGRRCGSAGGRCRRGAGPGRGSRSRAGSRACFAAIRPACAASLRASEQPTSFVRRASSRPGRSRSDRCRSRAGSAPPKPRRGPSASSASRQRSGERRRAITVARQLEHRQERLLRHLDPARPASSASCPPSASRAACACA